MAKGNKEKRMSLKTALREYEHTPRDKREDRKGAKALMEKANGARTPRGKK